MGHDYNYRVGDTALVPTYARSVRIVEGTAPKRAELAAVAFQHGVQVAGKHWSGARLARLDTVLPLGGEQDALDGHAALARLLCDEAIVLKRNHPSWGEVQARAFVADGSEQLEDMVTWSWPVWLLDGTWEDTVPSTITATGLTTSGTINLWTHGNHPVEPVVTITCQANGSAPSLTAADGSALSLAGAWTAGQVIVVDVPNRNVTVGGTRNKTALTVTRGEWMQFDAASGVVLTWAASSGTWDVSVSWRERWR